jgi:hypothetical protein
MMGCDGIGEVCWQNVGHFYLYENIEIPSKWNNFSYEKGTPGDILI